MFLLAWLYVILGWVLLLCGFAPWVVGMYFGMSLVFAVGHEIQTGMKTTDPSRRT